VPRPKRDIESALVAKGFAATGGDHNFFVYHSIAGKKTRARTKTSHTPKMKDVPDNLLAVMAKQCKITKSGFLDLIDCPMQREQYEKLPKELGEL
jgi:hypothetical protein